MTNTGLPDPKGCPLCNQPVERLGARTIWTHPGDTCILAGLEIPLACVPSWDARVETDGGWDRAVEKIEAMIEVHCPTHTDEVEALHDEVLRMKREGEKLHFRTERLTRKIEPINPDENVPPGDESYQAALERFLWPMGGGLSASERARAELAFSRTMDAALARASDAFTNAGRAVGRLAERKGGTDGK